MQGSATVSDCVRYRPLGVLITKNRKALGGYSFITSAFFEKVIVIPLMVFVVVLRVVVIADVVVVADGVVFVVEIVVLAVSELLPNLQWC